ncbi:MAG: DUF4242 domain-containing protein [Desulfobacteraceae bacterium]|nr:MAG: DUF4242 domain-containing protein [Desulfobacteraceae bacterium]
MLIFWISAARKSGCARIFGNRRYDEVASKRETPQPIHPDVFIVSKAYTERFFQQVHAPDESPVFPVAPGAAPAAWADVNPDGRMEYEVVAAVMELRSERQPEVTALICADWGLPQDTLHITVQKIRRALGTFLASRGSHRKNRCSKTRAVSVTCQSIHRRSNMPIYMDRHHMKGATTRTLADAHRKDLKIQRKYGINLMTYWFDEKRGSAFCLMDAPTQDHVTQMHAEAHGAIPNKIMEVSPEIVASFLGRIEDPLPAPDSQAGEPPIDSAFRAIMFTDMQDSTAMTTRLGDKAALALFRIHNAISRDAIKAYGGREIQHTGDGFFVSFASAVDAVDCAVAMQNDFAAHNRKNPEMPIQVRIGLSAGEPIEEDHRLFGSTVQLAARMCDKAQPGQILIAPAIRDLCKDQKYRYIDQGGCMLKGFDEPVNIIEVVWLGAGR